MNVFIAGYPYVRKEYFATFNHYPNPDELVFLLPRMWKAKGGKVVFHPPKDSRIITTRAFFTHSHYPVLGGLLKGWMPAFPLVLFRGRHGIDLVYSCSEPTLLTTLYYGFWSKLFGKKHVVFSWENIPYWEKFSGLKWMLKETILKLNLFFADGIICGNKKGAEIFKQLTNKPIVTIPMSGVDVDFFQPRRESRHFRDYDWDAKVVFTFAGAISYRKGIHLILEAFPDVLARVPNAHLVIAGSGEYEKEADALIQRYNLRDAVTRISWLSHEELVQLLDVSDVFLYPSIPNRGWEEQFGYSMAEALLMELPVIATRSGSIEELVFHDKTGILVEPNNVKELRDAMIRLGRDPDLRKKLGQAGRAHIIAHFSHSVVAQKFFEFFSWIR